jgi:hypothetical protein
LKTIELRSNMVMFIPFPLYIIMVFDNWKNDCLVVYRNSFQNKQNDLSK